MNKAIFEMLRFNLCATHEKALSRMLNHSFYLKKKSDELKQYFQVISDTLKTIERY